MIAMLFVIIITLVIMSILSCMIVLVMLAIDNCGHCEIRIYDESYPDLQLESFDRHQLIASP